MVTPPGTPDEPASVTKDETVVDVEAVFETPTNPPEGGVGGKGGGAVANLAP